jgi:hypothetical protein
MGQENPENVIQPHAQGELQEQTAAEGGSMPGHIEVTSHDDGQHAVEVGTTAVASTEGAQSGVQAEASEPTHFGTIDHDDSADQQEPKPATFINNVGKAHDMAAAFEAARVANEENNGRTINPDYAAEKAAEDHDLGVALKEVRVSHVDSAEKAREYSRGLRSIFLRYSQAIAENNREHGDAVSPGLQALEMVHDLVGQAGANEFPTSRDGTFDPNKVLIRFNETKSGQVVVETGSEYRGGKKQEWELSMFGRSTYKETEVSADPEGKFQRVVKTGSRELTQEDVDALAAVIEPAKRHRDSEKRRWDRQRQEDEMEDDDVIRSGDPEYEDAMRDIHYGRDGTDGKSYLEQNYGIKP